MLIARNSTNCNDSDIKKLEEKFGLPFSEQYVLFLKKYNGGETPETKAKIGRTSTYIRYFYGTGTNYYSFDGLDSEEWKERGIVPIASDTFGNYFVMDRDGSVLFCDHEKGFATNKIAEDFNKFISLCKSDPIDEGAKMPVEQREAEVIAEGNADIITDTLRQIWKDEYEKYVNMVQEKVILE